MPPLQTTDIKSAKLFLRCYCPIVGLYPWDEMGSLSIQGRVLFHLLVTQQWIILLLLPCQVPPADIIAASVTNSLKMSPAVAIGC